MPGPVAKRSEDRIRRNVPEFPVEKLYVGEDTVTCPDLNIPGAHQIAEDWYYGLAQSAQSKYYEPSDWQAARICALMISSMCQQNRPSSEMYKAIQTAFSDLLVTEGSRRRVRLEIVRAQKIADEQDESPVDKAMRMYQEMMQPTSESA